LRSALQHCQVTYALRRTLLNATCAALGQLANAHTFSNQFRPKGVRPIGLLAAGAGGGGCLTGVGSVNANKRHWDNAGGALARADRSWLARLVTRRERPQDFMKALQRTADDIKIVLQFSEV
jgi:hypothetical protein